METVTAPIRHLGVYTDAVDWGGAETALSYLEENKLDKYAAQLKAKVAQARVLGRLRRGG